MKKILFLLLILISCKETFNSSDFKGSWIHFDDNENYFNRPTISFKKDSVFFTDAYNYVICGNFKIESNKINLNFNNDTLKYNFKYNSKDSTITLENHKYVFWEGYYESNFKDYELINIEHKSKITLDSLQKTDCVIHLFKNTEQCLLLKLNDKVVSDFKLISRFITQKDKFNYTFPAIYVGENIYLKDLLNIYFELWTLNFEKTMLILKFDLENNLYHTYLDEFEFWDDQITSFYRNKKYHIEPFKIKYNSRNKYLIKHQPQIITIHSKKDFFQLKSITKKGSYLVKINRNMRLATYITLKEKIALIKNKNLEIKTEFSLF